MVRYTEIAGYGSLRIVASGSPWNMLIVSAGWLRNVRPAVAQNADGRIESL